MLPCTQVSTWLLAWYTWVLTPIASRNGLWKHHHSILASDGLKHTALQCPQLLVYVDDIWTKKGLPFFFPLDSYSSFVYISSRMHHKRQKYWSALVRSVISPFFCSESTLWWDSRKVATTETWDRFVFLLLYLTYLLQSLTKNEHVYTVIFRELL